MSSKPESEKLSASGARPYQAPTLIKGPILTSVTAAGPLLSGTVPVPVCWIARAAFGETDLRWMIFREWLVVDAPAWFRDFYIRHGEAIGFWLSDRAGTRKMVRTLMIPAVNRILRRVK
jgi:hypothetical protein